MDSQRDQKFGQTIEESLAAVLSGEESLEMVVAQYPEQDQELRAAIEAAAWLSSRRDTVRPRPGFVQASRKRLVSRIQSESAAGSGRRASLGLIWPRRFLLQFASALTIFTLLFISTFSAVSASQSTVPGEDFYPIKRISEDVQYALTLDAERRAELSLAFSGRRLNEVEILIARGDYEAAAPALTDFEYKVNQSIALLQGREQANSPEVEVLAERIQEQLDHHTQQINYLLEIAPAAAIDGLTQAQIVSQRGADRASEVILNERPTQTPRATTTPVETNTLVSPTAKVPPGQNNNPGRGITMTRTPRPTIEKRPTKTDKPDKPDKPGRPDDPGNSGGTGPPDVPPGQIKKTEENSGSGQGPPETPPGQVQPTSDEGDNENEPGPPNVPPGQAKKTEKAP